MANDTLTGGSVGFFTIFGVPIRLHFTFLLLLIFLLFIGIGERQSGASTAIYILALFGSVLLHELGHALVARYFGIRTVEIVMFPIGGVSRPDRPPKAREELWIALAGPTVNLLIAGAIAFWAWEGNRLAPLSELLQPTDANLMQRIGVGNLILAMFNFLPAYPMDGGRVLRSLLARWRPEDEATRMSAATGQALAVGLGLFGLLSANFMLVFIAMFVYLGAQQEGALARGRILTVGFPVRAAMVTDFRTLQHGDTIRDAGNLLLATSQQDFPVMHGGGVVGLLTRSALIRAMLSQGPDAYVAGAMDRNFVRVPPEMDLSDAFAKSIGSCALVMEEDNLLGLLTAENLSEFLVLRRINFIQGKSQGILMHRVAIVGGGFGGLLAAKGLARAPVEVTLVDRRNYHLFQPLLYQVATGGLSPGEIASPLRHILRGARNTSVWLAEVTDIDVDARTLILDGRELPYNTLILAAGSRNHYFGKPWQEAAPGLKSIEDATEIRSRILRAFEAAEMEADAEKRRAWLTFVLIGGGPTGVELAGALGEIANDTLRHDFRSINPAESRILLLEGSDRILSAFPPDLSEAAERQLIRLGVRTRTKVLATEIDSAGVTIQVDGVAQRIASHTVLWAAGVQASPLGAILKARAGATLDRGGRVIVEPDLSVPGHPEILVIGDMASFSQEGKPLPGVAPVAMQQGTYVAHLIQMRLRGVPVRPFHYFNKGNLATIGRRAAVADFGVVRFSGLFAWLTWLFVHLMYLVGFQNRLLVLIKWVFDYVTRNRGARLITK